MFFFVKELRFLGLWVLSTSFLLPNDFLTQSNLLSMGSVEGQKGFGSSLCTEHCFKCISFIIYIYNYYLHFNIYCVGL
jgi:hypothetical protein